MNLFWLRYVSYASLAGAAFFYFVLRLKKLALSRTTKLGLYTACIVLACLAWHAQESNADQYSPRRLVIGTVTWVGANRHRYGSIDDQFQMNIGAGRLSPKFSTDTVASSAAQQPIHTGDTLGVLYRTWDNVPLTIDELAGEHPGWHYRRYRALDPFVWAVALVGCMGFLAAFLTSRDQNKPEPGPTANFGDGGS